LFTDIVNHADVGMIERGSSLCFTLETCERLRVSGYIIWKELERHETVEPAVLGLIDHTHTATAELLDNVVMGDRLADHEAAMLGGMRWQVNESQTVADALVS
jgi:hypothetical protein